MKIERRNLAVSGTFTNGQIMLDSTLVNDFFGASKAIIRSIVLLDKDNQKAPLDIVFMRRDTSIGTVGQAVSVNDVNANRIYGIIQITNYIDLVNSAISQRDDLWLPLESLNRSNDLYIALISRGAGTYVDGMTIKLGIEER